MEIDHSPAPFSTLRYVDEVDRIRLDTGESPVATIVRGVYVARWFAPEDVSVDNQPDSYRVLHFTNHPREDLVFVDERNPRGFRCIIPCFFLAKCLAQRKILDSPTQ